MFESIENGGPIGLIAVATFVLMFAAAWCGERLHLRRPAEASEERTTQDGYVLSGVVGLLALLLGFTFALAVDRFDARRLLVLDEANAIRTAYLQAQSFPEPHRARLQGLLAFYAGQRLILGRAAGRQQAEPLLDQTHRVQDRMWAETLAAVEPRRDDVASTFMASMSEVLAVGAARRMARETHVPGRVFVMLFVYMIVTASTVGFVMGPKRRHAVSALLILITLSYMLILDIDEATRGGVRESQRPMEELKALVDHLQASR